jgi:hypothetical protein
MKRLVYVLLIIFLVSCSTPELSTPASTPEPIQVIFSPSLSAWADKFSTCASKNPLIALYNNPSPIVDMNINPNSVVLQLGESSESSDNSSLSQIGWEQIDLISNQERHVSQLTRSDLQSIFSGITKNWDGDTGQPIQVWVFPVEEAGRKYFDLSVLQSYPITTEARLAPDPDAMIQAISNDPNSIGYIPESMISSSDPALVSKVKILQVDKSLQAELHQPVIAITKNEPEGLLRELLVCVQSIAP